MGTFGGALEARQIDASNGRLTADVTGEVEQEQGVLVIRNYSRGNASGSAGRGEGDNSACAQHLCDALPPVPHLASGNSTHILFRTGGYRCVATLPIISA